MNEPKFAVQLNEDGIAEKVDTSIYYIKMVCSEPGCFQVRYLRGQDQSQCTHCKPHAHLFKLRRRAARAREKRIKRRANRGM
jgi:hypothetical protein